MCLWFSGYVKINRGEKEEGGKKSSLTAMKRYVVRILLQSNAGDRELGVAWMGWDRLGVGGCSS